MGESGAVMAMVFPMRSWVRVEPELESCRPSFLLGYQDIRWGKFWTDHPDGAGGMSWIQLGQSYSRCFFK